MIAALAHAAFAMPRQIMRHLAATGGMANMDGVFEVEMGRESRQVVGVMIHVVAVGGLGGAAVATAIMRNHAIAMTEEEQHLCVPIVGRQRPAVTENDWLARTPVLVEDLDAVFGFDRRHSASI